MAIENIWIAASDGKIEDVKRLIDTGFSPDAKDDNGYTPMHAAASYGHLDLINLLISLGADINITDTDGDTPLHVACNLETVTLLIEKGADATKRNEENYLPIESLHVEGLTECVEYLKQFTPEFVEYDQEDQVNLDYLLNDLPENLDDMSDEMRAQVEELLKQSQGDANDALD
ncbi:hypothetical protein HDV06_002187 [Boothiomyces sp. JEL0866]|nr:hypothetical protein HDV06_002187 [Boothiomyces sp. JEL0866]